MTRLWPWAAFSLLYFVAVLTSTFTKELWFDELVSVYVDRLPDLGSVWRALAESADAMPPLFHIATRASHAAIGDEATAARLPGAIGYWVACISAWIFLRRRMSAAYAWCALAVMLLPGPFYFATEGRAYGMVLGFSGLMLLCWQSCLGPGRRAWHPLGLAVFLCCAVSSHYFAVFLTIPLSLAELFRMRFNSHRGWRRCDWPVLAAVGSGLIPLVFHLPLIGAADIYRADMLAAPKLYDGFRFYLDILSGVGPALLAALVAAAAVMRWKPQNTHDAEPEGLHRVEIVMVIGFLLIPFAVLGCSLLITGMFYPRYALAALFGLMFTAAELLRRLCPRHAAAVVFSVVLLLVVGAQRGLDIASNWRRLPTAGEMSETARLTKGPVVVEEAFGYIQAFYYAPPELAARLWYVSDAKVAMASIGLGNPDLGLDKLLPYGGFNLGSRERFVEQPGTFYLLVDPVRLGWLLGELERRQARVELLIRFPRRWLMKVTHFEGTKPSH